jgi:hypothetical protein
VIKSPSGIRRVLRALGPGVTTGAADDDPSGVSTYSVAGAQFGTAFLWSALITWPLMGCVQMMCARIGMVTGMGLAGALRANQLARYAWPSGPRARSQAESGLGTDTMSNTLHRPLRTDMAGIRQKRSIVRKPSVDPDRGRTEEPREECELLEVIGKSVRHRYRRHLSSR